MSTSVRKRLFQLALVTAGLVAVFVGLVAFAWLTSPAQLARSPFPVPAPSHTSWADVLADPQPIELESLATGACHIDKRLLLDEAHPVMDEFRDDGSAVIVYAHLIRHSVHGDVLIDSGLDQHFADNRFGNLRGLGRWASQIADITYSQSPGNDLGAQLRARVAKPHTVFLSHLHADHTAGLPALAGAAQIVTGAGEADDWAHLLDSGHFDEIDRIDEIDFSQVRPMPPLGPAVDIFGDGSLWAIHTPGHSRGHLSFLVNAEAGAVLLVGDAAHFAWSFEHGLPPSGTDPAQADASLRALRAFRDAYPQVTIAPGHQPPLPQTAREVYR